MNRAAWQACDRGEKKVEGETRERERERAHDEHDGLRLHLRRARDKKVRDDYLLLIYMCRRHYKFVY